MLVFFVKEALQILHLIRRALRRHCWHWAYFFNERIGVFGMTACISLLQVCLTGCPCLAKDLPCTPYYS